VGGGARCSLRCAYTARCGGRAGRGAGPAAVVAVAGSAWRKGEVERAVCGTSRGGCEGAGAGAWRLFSFNARDRLDSLRPTMWQCSTSGTSARRGMEALPCYLPGPATTTTASPASRRRPRRVYCDVNVEQHPLLSRDRDASCPSASPWVTPEGVGSLHARAGALDVKPDHAEGRASEARGGGGGG